MKIKMLYMALMLCGCAVWGERENYIPEKAPWKGELKVYVQPVGFANEKDPRPRMTADEARAVYKEVDKFYQRESYGQVRVGSVKVAPLMVMGNSYEYSKQGLGGKTDQLSPKRRRALANLPEGAELPKKMKDLRNIPQEMLARYRKKMGRDLFKEYHWLCLPINHDPLGIGIGKAAAISILNGHGVVAYSGKPGARVLAHEHGHGCGMGHAMRWVPDDQNNPIDPNGKAIAYGHVFSPMGHGAAAFSVCEKVRAGWLEVVEENASRKPVRYVKQFKQVSKGKHRIYLHNMANAKGCVGLLIEKASLIRSPKEKSPLYYWLSLVDTEPVLRSSKKRNREDGEVGVLVEVAAYPFERACNAILLDMTPHDLKISDFRDPFLKKGKTFTDPQAGFSVTVLNHGKDSKGPYTDIELRPAG